jgi:hypothetical protein
MNEDVSVNGVLIEAENKQTFRFDRRRWKNFYAILKKYLFWERVLDLQR